LTGGETNNGVHNEEYAKSIEFEAIKFDESQLPTQQRQINWMDLRC
jgi:hypothetical protein